SGVDFPSSELFTLADLPGGFQETSPASMGLAPGTELYENLTIDESFAYISVLSSQFVFGSTASVPDQVTQAGFDIALGQPDFIIDLIATRIIGGATVTEQAALPALDAIGDASSGLTGVFDTNIVQLRVDVVAFREGGTGAFVAVMYLVEDAPIVSVEDVATTVSERIAAGF
ncbi:MAG: hypothetical protein L0177_19445, partial [Chloroflexi bacterium]|nr:hypothetical protein [Chloroflexota bacterium]